MCKKIFQKMVKSRQLDIPFLVLFIYPLPVCGCCGPLACPTVRSPFPNGREQMENIEIEWRTKREHNP